MNLDRSTDSGMKGPGMDTFVSTGVSTMDCKTTSGDVEESESDGTSSSIFHSCITLVERGLALPAELLLALS